MYLKNIYINNFRNIKELNIDLSNFCLFIGENNVGKTNILKAINKILKINESNSRIYFDQSDFFYDKKNNTRANQIIIQLTFSDLTEIDKSSFYFNINLDDDVITICLIAEWDEFNQDAIVRLFFGRFDDPENTIGNKFTYADKKFIPYYYIDAYRDALKESNNTKGDLKRIVQESNKNFFKPLDIIQHQLINKIKSLFEEEQNLLENEKQQRIIEITKSINEKKIDKIEILIEFLLSLKKGKNDTEINNIIELIKIYIDKIVISHDIDKIQTDFNKLERIVSTKSSLLYYISLFIQNLNIKLEFGKIDDLSLFSENVINIDENSLFQQGSGLQNSFVLGLKFCWLLTYLHNSDIQITNMIIAIEEPEAHMHPHLQRSFINKVKKEQVKLEKQGIHVQILITSHSPSIISQIELDELYLVKSNPIQSVSVTRFNQSFFNTIYKLGLSIKDKKHFDYLFRLYPEIFLSRCVILVEGQSEFGAFPEFAKKNSCIDQNEKGITIVNAESIHTIRPYYLIIKKITHCIAIRDNEGENNNDEFLVNDDSEFYYTTDLKDFEEEMVNSIGVLNLIKILILIAPDAIGKTYYLLINEKIPEFRGKPIEFIQKQWNLVSLQKIEMDSDKLILFLKKHCKNSLIWKEICSNITCEQIPLCYLNIFKKVKEIIHD